MDLRGKETHPTNTHSKTADLGQVGTSSTNTTTHGWLAALSEQVISARMSRYRVSCIDTGGECLQGSLQGPLGMARSGGLSRLQLLAISVRRSCLLLSLHLILALLASTPSLYLISSRIAMVFFSRVRQVIALSLEHRRRLFLFFTFGFVICTHWPRTRGTFHHFVSFYPFRLGYKGTTGHGQDIWPLGAKGKSALGRFSRPWQRLCLYCVFGFDWQESPVRSIAPCLFTEGR